MIKRISSQKITRAVLLSSALISAKLVLIISLSLGSNLNAATANVNNNGDASAANPALSPDSTLGVGIITLRSAIQYVNAQGNPSNTITFSGFSGTITPGSNLPTIIVPVLIDGNTATGASQNSNSITAANNAAITVEIKGPGTGNAAAPTIGLRLGAGSNGSTIRGLAINNFANVTLALATAVGIRVDSNNNNITGNFIGTDLTGTIALPNFTDVLVVGNNNVIGGTAVATRNLIGGSYSYGNGSVRLAGINNSILQNTIGLNRAGTTNLMPDSRVGIIVNLTTTGGTTTIGGTSHATGNVVSGNATANILVTGNNSDILIENNYVGTDVTGSAAVGKNGQGILINFKNGSDVPHVLRIDGNLVSGNTYGIHLGQNIFSYPIRCAEITGNFIGTNVSGTAAIPNTLDGVWIHFAQGTYISGNTISGNIRNGIRLGKSKCSTIKSNFIGTDSGGGAAIPNGANGIQLGTQVAVGVPAFGDVIGGALEDEGNIISFNGQNGISLVSYTQEETIKGNTIESNGEYGIYLGPYTKNNYIGIYRQAGDHRLIGDLTPQGGFNLGPLGTSNRITNNTLGGIAVQNSNNNTIQTNIIQTNDGDGISITDGSFNLVGGKVGGNTDSTSVPPVRGNVITENTGFGVSVNQADGAATDNTIISNQIVDNTLRGIALVDL